MKYCPFCGAALPSDAVSFCHECGKTLAQPKPSETRPQSPKKERRQGSLYAAEEQINPGEGYDGYYDDIEPEDLEQMKQRSDKTVVIKIGFLIGGVLMLAAACVCIMCLL